MNKKILFVRDLVMVHMKGSLVEIGDDCLNRSRTAIGSRKFLFYDFRVYLLIARVCSRVLSLNSNQITMVVCELASFHFLKTGG